jgi:hypothetical protein
MTGQILDPSSLRVHFGGQYDNVRPYLLSELVKQKKDLKVRQ